MRARFAFLLLLGLAAAGLLGASRLERAPGVIPGLTAGSVLFSDGTRISQDNTALFWGAADKRLGVGTNTPLSKLEVASGTFTTAQTPYLWKFTGSLDTTASGDRSGLYLLTSPIGQTTSSYHGLLSEVSSTIPIAWLQAMTAYAALKSPVAITNQVSLMVAGHAPVAGATVTNLYGVYVDLGYVGDLGTVGTVYGGYFATPAMPATTKYALGSAGPTYLKNANAMGSAPPDSTTILRLSHVTDNDTILAVASYSVTGSSNAPMMNLMGTWNTTGAPSAIKLNITNTASDAASRLIDLQVGGSSLFYVQVNGAASFSGNLSVAGLGATGDVGAGAARDIYWAGRSLMQSPANGNIVLKNAAGTDFGLLQFGGVTASFPALKRSTTSLLARLADDSGYAGFDALGYSAGGVAGLTATKTVRAAGGAADCTLIYTGGILTGGTC